MSNTEKFFESFANDEAMRERAAASTVGLFDFAKSEGYDIAQGDIERFIETQSKAKAAPAAVGDDELEEITGGASVGFKVHTSPDFENTQLLYQNEKGQYVVIAEKVGDVYKLAWFNKPMAKVATMPIPSLAGKTPLTDEEVSNVAGGMPEDAPDRATGFYWMACDEGRKLRVSEYENGTFYIRYHIVKCPKCGETEGSLYCKTIQWADRGTLDCVDTKCYNCGYYFGNCELVKTNWQVYIQDWGR